MLAALTLVNVAGLNLVRTLSRESELSIRSSLGAGRARLAALLGAEAIIITAVSVPLGLLTGYWASRYLAWHVYLGPNPVQLDLMLTYRVAGVAVAGGIAAGLLFALLPIVLTRSSTFVVRGRMLANSELAGRHPGIRNRVLSAAQVATIFPFVVAALLLSSTLASLTRIDPGYRTENILLVGLEPRPEGYGELNVAAYYRTLVERISSLPAVESSTLTLTLPLDRTNWEERVAHDTQEATAVVNCVTPRFFETLEIPLLRGRDFEYERNDTLAKSAVLSHSLAARLFGDADPVGRRISLGAGARRPDLEVIGVARDARMHNLRNDPSNDLYLSCLEDPRLADSLALVIRTTADPLSLVGTARRTVEFLGVELATTAQPLTVQREQGLRRERLLANLSGALAAFGVLISSIGVFGLSAYSAARRRREMGVRMALGATGSAIKWLLLREHLGFLAAGVVVGLIAAVWLVRLIGALLYGVDDYRAVWFFTAAAVVAAVVSSAAVFLASQRAARADPTALLRSE